MTKILKEQFQYMDHPQVQVKNFPFFGIFGKSSWNSIIAKMIFNTKKGVTRALLKIAEFVEADLNDGLTGRTTKVGQFYDVLSLLTLV